MKEHSEDLLKPTKGMSHMKTVTPEKLSPTKLSKFDIYSDVKSRIKNLENDIVNWKTKNNDQILIRYFHFFLFSRFQKDNVLSEVK